MYEAYFGLQERPFSKTPDPRFLFLSKGHREALARMQYAVEERDLVLLTGEIGCGKTTLSRALMDALDDSFKVVCLINPRLTPLEFLSSLARHLGVTEPARFKVDLLEQIGKILFEYYENDMTPVVVIDEAQLVPHKETFDEIRLLTNFQLDDINLGLDPTQATTQSVLRNPGQYVIEFPRVHPVVVVGEESVEGGRERARRRTPVGGERGTRRPRAATFGRSPKLAGGPRSLVGTSLHRSS